MHLLQGSGFLAGVGWAHTLEQASADRAIMTAFIVWCVSFTPGGMHSTHRLPGSPRQFSEAEAIVGLALLKAERTNLKSYSWKRPGQVT